jgi:uncharacterized protein
MISQLFIKIIELYQKYISPDHSIWAKHLNKPPYCKFTPSCSNYMKEAIIKKWLLLWLMKWFFRILRCNPWSKWWYDPVDTVIHKHKLEIKKN